VTILVKDVMVKDVAYVTVPGSRDEVLKVLKERWLSGVPVVKDGSVVGMITRADLLRNVEEDQIAMLMSRNPYVIKPENTLVDAAKALLEHGIRRLPVVDEDKLVGIITIADVIRSIADLNIDVPIKGFYSGAVVVVWSEMPLPVVGAVMEYADVHACPVLDTDLNLVGIVTDRDLIAATVIEDSVERASEGTAPDEDEWTWESMRDTMSRYYEVRRITLKNIPVKEAMVEAITAIPASRVSECATIMRREKIDQLPVVNARQKLMGILLDRDLLRAFIRYREA